MPEEALRHVADRVTRVECGPGHTVFRAGDEADAFYVVDAGRVEVLVESGHGAAPTRVAMLGPGDCFGEMALLTGEPRSATVQCVEPVSLLRVDTDDFRGLVADVSVYQHLVALLCARLRSTDGQVEEAQRAQVALSRYLDGYRSHEAGKIVGATARTRKLAEMVEEASASDAPVLVEGEAGSGKRYIATMIARDSGRAAAPFIIVDCATAGSNAASELFGYEKGSMEGASSRQLGSLELCAEGTVLIAEPRALSAMARERLTEAMLAGAFRRIGGTEDIPLRARLLFSQRIAPGPEEPTPECLDESLVETRILVPALRDRRKDIPLVAAELLERHSRALGRPTPKLTQAAMGRLLAYDWPMNVAELSAVMRRGAALASDGTVDADQIIIDLPPSGREGRIDLLRFPRLSRFLRSKWYPAVLQVPTALVLGFICCQCFFGPQDDTNVALKLTWPIWWAALPITFLFLGRIWCSVCPFALLSSITQRLYSLRLKVPEFLKRTEIWPMTGLFVFLTWADEYWHYPDSPMYTGVVLASVLGGTLLMSFLFERRTWCRYLCPLGGVNGVYSTSAIIEVRANRDVCANHCRGHECAAADSSYPCPMLERPLILDNNRSCNLCMNCVKACPHDAMRVFLRQPGAEVWEQRAPMLSAGILSVLLAGTMLVHSACMRLNSSGRHLIDAPPATWLGITDERVAWTVAYALALALPLVLVSLMAWLSAKRERGSWGGNLAEYGMSFAILAVLMHIALEGGEFLAQGLPTAIGIVAGLVGQPGDPGRYLLVTPLLVRVIQVSIGVLGVALTWYAISRIGRKRAQPGAALPHLAASGIAGLVFLGFLLTAHIELPLAAPGAVEVAAASQAGGTTGEAVAVAAPSVESAPPGP